MLIQRLCSRNEKHKTSHDTCKNQEYPCQELQIPSLVNFHFMDSSNAKSYEMSTHKGAKGFKFSKVGIGVIYMHTIG